jgi:hypothetical protein
LATRAALARCPAPHDGRTHCDLLHAARRAWSHRAASCRLSVLERELLGVRRRQDVEGRYIPAMYVDYLQSGRGALLDPVLAHNRHDLVSLLLLAAQVARFLAGSEQGEPFASDPESLADDRLSAARVLWSAGEPELAARYLELCLAGVPSAPARLAARSFLAYIRKRQGDLESACRLWQDMLREDPDLVDPVEELAKVLEHGRRDAAAALGWVDGRVARAGLDVAAMGALLHRQARLRRKSLRAGGGDVMLPQLDRLEPGYEPTRDS